MDLAWLEHPARRPDPAARAAALARQALLTKPAGALGELERLAVTLAALQGRTCPTLRQVHIAVFAADHGVAAAGVSAYPQAVTGEMVRNFAAGGAAISVLARELAASLEVVQLGTVNDPGPLPGVRRDWIAPATANFLDAPAMDDTQLARAFAGGRHSVTAAAQAGAELFVGGEMGIGNTTAATALACALLGDDPQALTGAGTGLDAAGMRRKAEIIARALQRHRDHLADPRQALRRLGGFEIAALAGAYIAAAQQGVAVLVDGFIASVAALAAVRLNPACRDWLLFAHRSAETGHARVLAALQAQPLLDLGLRLGEGSGAGVAVPLLRLACALHAGMATFAEAGVSDKAGC
ncbi:MAG: nicotinate-nucleotide--dimethylbenzimidazole phosphoribosyltransferase [Lysobacterales bacterium 69-70]|nr:nicotinate-nucleotide--dimethylbenzimidazole phosphoribosyltransferase [Xanthomonadaceae bacterium]ODU33452.1 MAG: nicotinate-nucleotide--dimethylbenzimidazole phosphoribosyltransferase [Xanthomonadaceae bacterium SCN 69-320]ODV17746.1 MAG: nicotinate-nucleotide--dimethylbenzimidazole phosphoribosyltransferase [Xanthomonadaceae bacterium SCN 69-25]OJZ00993.1 MAG: nicotinate-nucleotide--dimethylbenzimidazole phosphoribosyltransferase [Xanthomonadales bacterium 69-70]